MKSWHKESLLLILCAVVIVTSSAALYREITGQIDKNSNDSIGIIIFKKKNAERKYAEYVIWEDIYNNSPVYNYDSVRTFQGSAAYIRLKNGVEISLDEDTMIVLIADEKGLKINFDTGSVSAKSGGSTDNISLNTKDVSISISNGEVAVKKNADIVDVNVSSGKASIDAGAGDIKTIDNNVAARVVKGKTEVRKIMIIPEFPADNSFFITYKDADSIPLNWKSDSNEEETVQLSNDSQFREIVYTVKTNSRKQNANIVPGDYYWRILSGKEQSVARKFTLLKDSVPLQLYPAINENVSVSGDDENVSFKWNLSEYASSYDFVLAHDRNLENRVKSITLTINSASVENVPAGHLWWRVKRNYPEGFILIDNDKVPGDFNLERTTIVRVKPKPIHDGKMHVSTLAESVIFNWEGGSGVKDYTVDISSDNEFKNIIRTTSVSMTFYNSGKLPEGDYFWRVRANYEKGESLLSETVSLSVSPPEPVVYLTPVNGSIIQDTDGPVKFTWRDSQGIGNYLFETSSDSEFKKVVSSVKTEAGGYLLNNPGSGKFFWRVSIMDKNGLNIAKGETRIFIIPDVLQKPVVSLPSNMGIINLDNTDVIKFQWSNVPGADIYEVEIFQRISGVDRSLIVLSAETPRIELRNFTMLDTGTIIWIVRAKKSEKGKVLATSESDRNYFILKVSDDIPAPKINASDTVYVK